MSLQTIIQQIKTASLPGENTALRVGSAFEQMDAAKRDKSDSLSASETIDMVNSVKLLAATGTPFLGTIEPSTTIPAGNFWAFAAEGTYANAGGIVVGAGEIAIITRVGTAFDSVILDVPVKSIEDVEKTSTVGLVDTYTITYSDGSTPTTFEVTNGDGNTDDLNKILYSFLNPEIVEDKTLLFSDLQPIYGVSNSYGNLLIKDNSLLSYSAPNQYPSAFRNIPTRANGIKSIKIKISTYYNDPSNPSLANVVGINDSGVAVPLLMDVSQDTDLQEFEINIEAYVTISIGVLLTDANPDASLGFVKFYKAQSGAVEIDSVLKAINSKGGYSGEIDTASLGVKESNTALQNTNIVNQALIDAEVSKKTVLLPPGTLKFNTINLRPFSRLKGAGIDQTRIEGEVGTSSLVAISYTQAISRIEISDLSITGLNYVDGGIYIKLTFDSVIKNVGIYFAKNYAMLLEGCLYHKLENVYIHGTEGTGLQVYNTAGMNSNLIKYDRVYITESGRLCAYIGGGSNYEFSNCNFENSGISGDETTGGIILMNLSSEGEGVDVVFNNCWSEGIRGGFIYKFQNCTGSSEIRGCMLGKGGNGSGSISNAIINDGCKLELGGATRFSGAPSFTPFPTNIRTINGGSTFISSPHINVGTNNVGTLKKVSYTES